MEAQYFQVKTETDQLQKMKKDLSVENEELHNILKKIRKCRGETSGCERGESDHEDRQGPSSGPNQSARLSN